MPSPSTPSWAAGQVLLAAVLFGTTGTAQALGPEGSSPLLVGAGRVALGGLLLALLAAAAGRLRDGIRWRPAPVLVTGAAVAAYQLCFFAGVQRAGVALGTIVTIGSAPAFTGLLGWLAGQGRPGRVWAVATGLAVVGGALLVGSGSGELRPDPSGVGLALASGIAYAGYTVAAKGLLDDGHHPLGVMGRSFGLGGVLLLPVVVVLGPPAVTGSPSILLVIGYLAVLPTLAAYVLFARGLAALPAASVATLTLAEPLVAAVLGVVVLTEPVTAARAAGAALVVAGLAVLARRAGRVDR